MTTPPSSAETARVFAEEYGRAVATLVRVLGDIDAAEEAVAEAFAVAVERCGEMHPSDEPADHALRPFHWRTLAAWWN